MVIESVLDVVVGTGYLGGFEYVAEEVAGMLEGVAGQG